MSEVADLERGVRALRARRFAVILAQVVAPGELDPGRTLRHGVLRDAESDDVHAIRLTRAALAEYRTVVEEHLAALARARRSHGKRLWPPRRRHERRRFHHRRPRAARARAAAMSAAGMANPSGVLAFLALAALLALYLRIRRRQAIPVATLFLWRRVRAPLVEPRRFRPDALFWLQATILAALAAGYVRPYLDRPTGPRRRRVSSSCSTYPPACRRGSPRACASTSPARAHSGRSRGSRAATRRCSSPPARARASCSAGARTAPSRGGASRS
jgi:hypothetical protein